jgi:hypothetical protein
VYFIPTKIFEFVKTVLMNIPLPFNTECGRNSELIMYKNNILLNVIGTNFSTSQFTIVLNFLKVTAFIKIPALRDTLAENHLTKILKRFTISAAPCITPCNL